ncbi:hypothetical protein ACR79M_08465 [Sphingobacterium spiritivorum]|uniref:hypothetical protein n=1 Tax=Sphingobacterium spiritivorum TaxID=258 RepID=UPI003DA66005
MSCEICLSKGVPEHLCSFDKTKELPFIDDECIFRRISNDLPISFDSNKPTDLHHFFPLKNDSYNRSTISNPNDVLIDDNGINYDNHSIFSILISDINSISKDVPNGKDEYRNFSLKVVYCPLDCNYAHCEIHCFLNGQRIDPKLNPKSAKLFMRDQLRRLLRFN